MNNFGVAVEATATAQSSAGSAAKENSAYMESLAAKVQGLKAAWQNLVTEGGIINKFIKLVLDAGTAVLKFANSDLGQMIIKLGALAGVVKLVSVAWTAWTTKTVTGAVFAGMTNGVMGLTGAIKALTLTMLENPLFWAVGAGLLIFGLAKIIETDAEKFERLNKEIDKNNQKISELQSEYDKLNGKALEDLTESEKERLEVLESQLNTIKEQNKELQKQAYETYKPKAVKTEVSGGEGVGGGLGVGAVKVTQTAVEDYIKTLKTLNGVETENKQILADHAKQLLDFKDAGIELNEADKDFLETYEQLSVAYNAGSEAAQNYGNALGGVVIQQMQQLTAAMQEQNETGSITKQTYENLLKVFPTLGNYVDTTTGKIRLNKNAVQDLVGATSEARNAALQFVNGQGSMQIATNATTQEIRKQIVALLEQARAAYASYSSLPTSAIRTMPKSELQKYQNARANIDKIKGALDRLDAGMLEVTGVTQDYTGGLGDNTEATDKNTSSKDKNTKSTKEQTKAEKEAAKALKDANKELDKQKKKLDNLIESYENAADAYKITANYMVDQIDKEIDALEKQKEIINSTYDEAIKAKEDEISERQKAIDKVNEENDAIEEQMALAKAQQALAEAKSKKVLVFKGGQLQYTEDSAAVQEAQANLEQLQRQQQQKANEKAAQAEIEQLESERDALETLRDNSLKTIDDQIAIYEKYRQEWADLGDAYENEQNRLIAQQVLGIKLEGDNWKKRIANADTYTKEYMKIMNRLGVLQGFELDVDTGKIKSVQSATKDIKSLLGNYKTQTSSLPTMPKEFSNVIPKTSYNVGSAGNTLTSAGGSVSDVISMARYAAGGATAKSTFSGGNTVVQQFGDISLPNVTNASQFVEELKHFNNYAVQATSRR